ncbi:MAG: hypothetical protein KF773_01850 [Deltaproteobacteria bacterium]|nr:hypothetical protein [Deltaproteobacteria bacterium]MCW5800919.1 hypothetical protein [Deltaproteobacteria bacterium]
MRLLLLLAVIAGCGREIGDKCIISTDCDPNGTRQCDSSAHEGYCTIQGCDVGTCPDEAVCVRFFTGSFANRPCDPATEDRPGGTNECTFDELCSLAGHCVPRSSEIRFCMKICESASDCRDKYECRNLDLMRAHGGEPVLEPGTIIDEKAPNFCAAEGTL